MRNTVHNIFIDHLHDPWHHHHGSDDELNIVHHKHDCPPDDDIYVGAFHDESDYDLDKYGPANHDHKPAVVVNNQLVHNHDPYGHDNNDDD